MKIAFNLGTLTKGGAERVVANLSDYLVKIGNNVSIIISVEKKSYYELNEKVNLYGLDEKKVDKNFLLKNIRRLKELKKILKKIEPDIVVSFLPEPSFRVLFLKIFNRKLKIIVSVRNDPKVEYKSRLNKNVMRILYPLADGFVFQTEEAKQYFSKKIQKKSIIIPNPIKDEFLRRKLYEGERENIIVSVGRLEEQKNHKLLIDAFFDISEKIKNYNLVIYGEGSLREKLEDKIKKLNMQHRIFLPGIVDNIAEKIEKAKLFVLSSDYEGMPNALMEAMALGLPCISTDCPCGGPRFLIENNKNGYLIKLNDKDELSNAMEKLLLRTNKETIKNISNNARMYTYNLNEEKINSIWYKYICKIENSKIIKKGKL